MYLFFPTCDWNPDPLHSVGVADQIRSRGSGPFWNTVECTERVCCHRYELYARRSSFCRIHYLEAESLSLVRAMFCGMDHIARPFIASLFRYLYIGPQAEASPGEIVGLELVAAPAIDTESSPQASSNPHNCPALRSIMEAKRCTGDFRNMAHARITKVTQAEGCAHTQGSASVKVASPRLDRSTVLKVARLATLVQQK